MKRALIAAAMVGLLSWPAGATFDGNELYDACTDPVHRELPR